MLLTEYDADLHIKATYEEGHEDGLAEGKEIGHKAGLAEGREIGHKAGLDEGLLSGIKSLIGCNQRHNLSKETTMKDLILEFSLTEEQAGEYLANYWK